MNLELADCTVSNQETRLLQVHIRGSTIRYIHFPNQTDLSGVIRSGIDREKAAANKYKRGKVLISSNALVCSTILTYSSNVAIPS